MGRAGLDGGLRGAGLLLARDEDLVAAALHLPARHRVKRRPAHRLSVRKLMQAWCHGHRTVSPTISPSASGPL